MTRYYFLLLVLILFGCKKDRLEGEKSILEGKWRWIYSMEYKKNLTTQNVFSIETIPASSFSDTYDIEFLSKGCVHYLKNNEVVEKYRIVFSFFKQVECELTNCNNALIYLNNKEDNKLACFVNSDTMLIYPVIMPLQSDTVSNVYTYYRHYFTKAN